MLLLRSQILNFLMYFLIVVFGTIGLPFALASKGGAYWIIKRYCETLFWLLRVICNLRVEFRGEPPTGEVLICSKHMSFLDIVMLAYALPRAKFVMKRELIWAPFIGLYAWRIGSAPVARGKKGKAVTKMVSQFASDTGDGAQTVIFPQGTRVLPGSTLPYKVGAGVIYTRLKQVCVPVATNVGVFWARRSAIRKPGVAVLEFLDPIDPGMNLRAFMSKIESEIEENSNRLMREAGADV